jgi:2-keto-4-pentenoate hydratase
METDEHSVVANALLRAHRRREPIAPLTDSNPEMTVEDAYAIQALQVSAWEAEGRAIVGYKVGLTSAAMQQQLGVDEPDYGYVLEGMTHADGAAIDLDAFISPRIEPEIAVTLKRQLAGPGLSLDDVVNAVGSVVPILEIIDSRIANWNIKLPDTIADNASSAGVVVGDMKLPLDEADIAATKVVLSLDGEPVGAGSGREVMGSPLNAVLWLANRLGELGVVLQAGAIVLPGSVCASVPVVEGNRFIADFGALGTVSATFVKGTAV